MNQLEIIDSILSNSNNIEQMGRTCSDFSVKSEFGEEAFIICGNLNPKASYIYVYGEPLSHNSYKPKADAIVYTPDSMIFLYGVD